MVCDAVDVFRKLAVAVVNIAIARIAAKSVPVDFQLPDGYCAVSQEISPEFLR